MADSGGGGVEGAAAADIRGVGEAEEGGIRAVASPGRLRTVELDPRLLRKPAGELAEGIVAASNAAFGDLRAKVPAAPVVDPAALAASLADFQDQALRAMNAITQAIGEAMVKLREHTTVDGDPTPRGLEHLLEQTRGVVDALRDPDHAADQDSGDEDLCGEGRAEAGRVLARVSLDGPVTSLEIDRRAVRGGSHQLGLDVVAAVNAALEDLNLRARERTGGPRVDPERLRALREESTEQMAAYTRSLRDLMSSIRPR